MAEPEERFLVGAALPAFVSEVFVAGAFLDEASAVGGVLVALFAAFFGAAFARAAFFGAAFSEADFFGAVLVRAEVLLAAAFVAALAGDVVFFVDAALGVAAFALFAVDFFTGAGFFAVPGFFAVRAFEGVDLPGTAAFEALGISRVPWGSKKTVEVTIDRRDPKSSCTE